MLGVHLESEEHRKHEPVQRVPPPLGHFAPYLLLDLPRPEDPPQAVQPGKVGNFFRIVPQFRRPGGLPLLDAEALGAGLAPRHPLMKTQPRTHGEPTGGCRGEVEGGWREGVLRGLSAERVA